MKRLAFALLGALTITAASSSTTLAKHDLLFWKPRPSKFRFQDREKSFQRVGTFANYLNNANAADQTVSEIIAATADGKTLVYTDGVMGAIGLIDIRNPSNPQPLGKVAFAQGHEPTSVDVLGNNLALVAVNSSESFTNPSGYLAVVDLATRTTIRQIDLGGQPDSIKISPDKKFAAIVIENERDEALCVGGSGNGLPIVDEDDYEPGVNTTEDLCEDGSGVPGGLPQTPLGNPAGYLAVIVLSGASPMAWTRFDVALTGLAGYAADDPEPEFVDINERNEAVVTMQENNHIAIVDLARRRVIADFSAGATNLTGIDASDDGKIALTESLSRVRREPDAVAWVPGLLGRPMIATANEGDLVGGSRGFSFFRQNGSLAFDSGSSLEEIAARHGHYPDSRSDAKGTEPEAIEYGEFTSGEYVFVGSERGSFVAVYELDRLGRPEFSQLLPAPLGPEGLLAIPGRNLLIASGEEDDPTFGVRSTVMIYELQRGAPDYPQIVSDDDEDGAPIGWSALSGMTSIPGQPDVLLAVWDSYFAESKIFRIDVSEKPAVITDAVTLRGGAGNYDPEGIAIAPDRSLWLASEGTANDSRQNLLIKVNSAGNVLAEIGLPPHILACRAATTKRGTLGSGFEGVAVVGGPRGYRLLVAQQRGWDYTTPECEALDDDGGGFDVSGEPNRTRIWVYDPQANTWDHIAWELAPKPANASWVGLSEITDTPWGDLILIERDNRTGNFGELKTLALVRYHATDDQLVTAAEKRVYDFKPRLTATKGWITDKPEGVAVMNDGRTFVVTDNDGVEDWSGESWFLRLGEYWRLFY